MSNPTSPDPIHFVPSKSYRETPYRLLSHQKGCIGNFSIRLVEAKNLVRSRSALSIGSVKRLGFSKANVEVSSYAEIRLGFRSREEFEEEEVNEEISEIDDNASSSECSSYSSWGGMGRTFPMTTGSVSTSTTALSTTSSTRLKSHPHDIFPERSKIYRSSTVSSNSNPKWPTAQSLMIKSMFDIPLLKGDMPQDGMKIIYEVVMREEKTTVNSFVSGGDEILGRGSLDVTNLVLRDNDIVEDGVNRTEISSQEFTEWDVWVNVYPDKRGTEKKSSSVQQTLPSDKKEGAPQLPRNVEDGETIGKVRLLVSYEPVGLNPRKGDIVALEAFARRPPSLSKCRPILPSLHPLKVVDVKDNYLLVNFDAVQPYSSNAHRADNRNNKPKTKQNPKKSRMHTGQVRLHRNSVFVIERTNFIDSAYNIALKPADIALSTSIGREVSHRAYPYVAVAGDLITPAVASARLLIEAAKISFAAAAQDQKPKRTQRGRCNSFPD